MGQGLRIDLNDGSPVMEIKAGLRCPSYCTTTTTNFSAGRTITIPGYVAGSDVFFIPKETTKSFFSGPSLIPVVYMLQGVSISGNQLTFNTWANDKSDVSRARWAGTVYQILPARQSGNQGLLIENSTDFTAITDNTVVGQLAWKGRVTVNKSWTLPTVSGFDRNSYSVFASWSANGVVVECDGNQIYALSERVQPGVGASVTLDIAIFAKGPAPVAGPGLNFFNAKGQCTFSTQRRPFIYGSTFAPSTGGVDVGNTMVCLGRYGFTCQTDGSTQYLKYLGLVRTGNRVRVGAGTAPASWEEYPLDQTRVSSLRVLTIPKMYV